MAPSRTKKRKASLPALRDEERRVCEVCGIEKYLRQFHNNRGAVCRSCHSLSQEQREERRFVSQIQPALAAFETKMREFLAHRSGRDIRVPHLMELYQQVSAKLGGVESWAEMYAKQVQEAVRLHPGTKTTLDYLRFYPQLAEAALAMRDSAPDIANMSDRELRTAILAELFVEVPEMFEALKSTRPDVAIEIVDGGFDPNTGQIRQEDSRFDADGPEDEIDDSQFDDDEAEEAEFTVYNRHEAREGTHAEVD